MALHEGRLFRNGGEAPSKGPATKPEAGRERIITLGRVEYLADRIALCASANET